MLFDGEWALIEMLLVLVSRYKDTRHSNTPLDYQKCTVVVSVHTICAHLHACILLAGGVWIKSFLPESTMKAQSATMSQTTSGPPHPPLAFTSGLLKMISAHGGQALAFAFYWKHGDLEQRIYQL